MTLGLGVMIQMLAGNPVAGALAWKAAIGKRIASASLTEADGAQKLFEDRLVLRFDDGTAVALVDKGQSCCESRYLRTDDDLAYYVGAVLLDARVLDAPSVDTGDAYGDHDVAFLHVDTDRGTFTISAHAEHNGYYGGFAIQAEEVG